MSLLILFGLLYSFAFGIAFASPKTFAARDLDGDAEQYLAAHNDFRAQHGADPLTWNDDLATKAQEWATRCIFEHSRGRLGPYGGDYIYLLGANVSTLFLQKTSLQELEILTFPHASRLGQTSRVSRFLIHNS